MQEESDNSDSHQNHSNNMSLMATKTDKNKKRMSTSLDKFRKYEEIPRLVQRKPNKQSLQMIKSSLSLNFVEQMKTAEKRKNLSKDPRFMKRLLLNSKH